MAGYPGYDPEPTNSNEPERLLPVAAGFAPGRLVTDRSDCSNPLGSIATADCYPPWLEPGRPVDPAPAAAVLAADHVQAGKRRTEAGRIVHLHDPARRGRLRPKRDPGRRLRPTRKIRPQQPATRPVSDRLGAATSPASAPLPESRHTMPAARVLHGKHLRIDPFMTWSLFCILVYSSSVQCNTSRITDQRGCD